MDLDDFLGKALNTMGDKLEKYREDNIKRRREIENMDDKRLIREFVSGRDTMRRLTAKEEIEHRGLQREAQDALNHRKRY